MGFGWLFLGYLIALFMSINAYGFLFVPVGLLLMWIGADELRLYRKRFIPAEIALGASFLVSVYQMLSGISGKFSFGFGFVSEGLDRIAGIAQSVLQLLWSVLILLAIVELAGSLGLGKIRMRAMRNLFYASAYYLLDILSQTVITPNEENGYLLLAALILLLISIVSHLLLFWSCYIRICPAGQEDMPRKPSRFGFVNRFRAAYDREEEKTTEATREWLLRKRRQNNANWEKKQAKKRKK